MENPVKMDDLGVLYPYFWKHPFISYKLPNSTWQFCEFVTFLGWWVYVTLSEGHNLNDLVGKYTLGCPPSQDASGKCRFSSGSPILKYNVNLVVFLESWAGGTYPKYTKYIDAMG